MSEETCEKYEARTTRRIGRSISLKLIAVYCLSVMKFEIPSDEVTETQTDRFTVTDTNIRALRYGDGGPATSAAVYGLIRDAAIHHGIDERFERVANDEA